MRMTSSYVALMTTLLRKGAVWLMAAGASLAAADPCCVLQDTFTNPASNMAIHDSTSVADTFFEFEQFTAQGQGSVGLETILADDLTIYNIPIYYGLPFSLTSGEEFLNFALLLPYVDNDVGLNSASGLGDLYLGVQYYRGKSGVVRKIGVGVKTKTGNSEKFLGTDSVDFSLSGGMFKRDGAHTYGISGGYDFKGSTGDDFIDYGNQVNFKLGYKYHISQRWAFTSGLVFARQANNSLGDRGAQFDAGGLQWNELLLGADAHIRKRLHAKMEINLPFSEKSLDNNDAIERDPIVRLGVHTNF